MSPKRETEPDEPVDMDAISQEKSLVETELKESSNHDIIDDFVNIEDNKDDSEMENSSSSIITD